MININILDVLLQANFLIKFIMLILTGFSVVSWAIIIQRTCVLSTAKRAVKLFEKKFWSGIELSLLYQEIQNRRNKLNGLERIFYVGFKEFIRLYHMNNHSQKEVIEGANRAMYLSINRELKELENYIPFLGNISSVSPYIGLFGTICGIMHSFISIGMVKQATLQMVAPGIAEALVATATGLFAAIPAVIAYNRLNYSVNKLNQEYNIFMEEFTSILHRQLFFSENKSENK